MKINPIGNTPINIKKNAKTAVTVGAITTGLQFLNLPREAKYCIKASLTKDYAKKAMDAAINTIKNLEEGGKESLASQINVREVIDKAKSFSASGKNILKILGRSFAGVTAGVLIGGIAADLLFNKQDVNKK